MNSLAPQFLDQLTFVERQVRSIAALGRFRGQQYRLAEIPSPILAEFETGARVDSIECSNRIEGITAPRSRIEALALRPAPQPRNQHEREISGYRYALEQIHGSKASLPIDENVLLQMHASIGKYSDAPSGAWKSKDNEIIERLPDGSTRIRFRPVRATKTLAAMRTLISRYQLAVQQDRREPLLVIPLAVLDFLCIHPFDDGNGRCSRLLTLLLLYHFDYEVGRYISVDRIIEQSQETYYEALEASSKGWHQGKHDPHPWVNYFWGVLIAAYKELDSRLEKLETKRGSKTEVVRAAIRWQLGSFAISDIESDVPGISREMVRVVLNQMREEGLIELQGKGRGAKWHRIMG